MVAAHQCRAIFAELLPQKVELAPHGRGIGLEQQRESVAKLRGILEGVKGEGKADADALLSLSGDLIRTGVGIMGGDENAVTVIDAAGAEDWPRATKDQVARRLAQRIADALA